MGFFSIDAADFEWIDGKEDNSTDLCLKERYTAMLLKTGTL